MSFSVEAYCAWDCCPEMKIYNFIFKGMCLGCHLVPYGKCYTSIFIVAKKILDEGNWKC